jgi:hypothetical protein
MAQRNVQRWDEMWVGNGAAGRAELETSNDGGPASWESTVNAALARMLEGDDAVERAIAARLLLAESYLSRLYHGAAGDEVVFAPSPDDE